MPPPPRIACRCRASRWGQQTILLDRISKMHARLRDPGPHGVKIILAITDHRDHRGRGQHGLRPLGGLHPAARFSFTRGAVTQRYRNFAGPVQISPSTRPRQAPLPASTASIHMRQLCRARCHVRMGRDRGGGAVGEFHLSRILDRQHMPPGSGRTGAHASAGR